jgi:hypothetical protein
MEMRMREAPRRGFWRLPVMAGPRYSAEEGVRWVMRKAREVRAESARLRALAGSAVKGRDVA